MELQQEAGPEPTPGIIWTAGWGHQLHEGDLLRVQKIGGPVRVRNLSRFIAPDRQIRPSYGPGDDGRWFWGAIVEDREGKQYHLFIQPTEAVYVGLEVPQGAGTEGVQPGEGDAQTQHPDH